MPIITSETGTVAAEGVARILGGAGTGVDGQLGAAEWVAGKLAEGGWTALTAAGSEAGLTLRDVLEVARATGRVLAPHALTTTLLAGRWFALDEVDLAGGMTFPVSGPGGTVLPYAVAGVRVVDGRGHLVGGLPDGDRDDFAPVLPLLPAPPSAAPVEGKQRAELYAVLAATATGCADAVLERAVGWVQTREQFGRPLQAFQALRHHLADMHIAREEGWTCAVAAGEETDRAARWGWTGVQRAKTVIETGIQVHGGIGFTWEAGIHQWLRHVLQIEALIGTGS